VVVAPWVALELGETYSLASGAPKAATELVVLGEDPLARLERVWPLAGGSAHAAAAVWCGAAAMPALAVAVELAPDDLSGALQTGALVDGQGGHCLRFTPSALVAADDASRRLPPPLWPSATDPLARLQPRPLAYDGPASELAAVDCEAGEQPFGPGCAWVADDRLLVRAPGAALLWSVAGAELDAVVATAGAEPFWLYPLPVDRFVELALAVGDAAGQISTWTFHTRTAPPMAHVVLNEVLANPVGAEPEQEWVELFNDGLAPAHLDGYVLVDVGGETPLPPAVLSPGHFALLVNDDYDESDELDPNPATDTLLLRVAALGKGGLNNQGEPLTLRDGQGQIVSRFPATPKPKSGVSVMRVHPKAPDGVESSFARSPEGPTPGAANGLER
jgi:hypothetical protein